MLELWEILGRLKHEGKVYTANIVVGTRRGSCSGRSSGEGSAGASVGVELEGEGEDAARKCNTSRPESRSMAEAASSLIRTGENLLRRLLRRIFCGILAVMLSAPLSAREFH